MELLKELEPAQTQCLLLVVKIVSGTLKTCATVLWRHVKVRYQHKNFNNIMKCLPQCKLVSAVHFRLGILSLKGPFYVLNILSLNGPFYVFNIVTKRTILHVCASYCHLTSHPLCSILSLNGTSFFLISLLNGPCYMFKIVT